MRKFRPIICLVVAGYVMLSLPVILVFAKSDYTRFIALQTVTHWKAKLSGVPHVYIGDSLTAGGRSWGTPLRAINLAGNGYLTWQIEDQIGVAEKYNPDSLFILAGTNDILGRRGFNLPQFESDYANLLDRAMRSCKRIFVIEIPFTPFIAHTEMMINANEVIRRLCADRGIATINLNSILAPEGILLPEYSSEGVHLSDSAYRVWRRKIAEVLN